MRGSYYDVLGVPSSASEEEIRARYLQLIRLYHPDRNHSPLAHARAAAINEAFRALTDASVRAGHDAQLAGKRQAVVAARAIDFSRDRGRALVVRRRHRRTLTQRYAARLAFVALVLGTAIVAWQIESRLLYSRAISGTSNDNGGDEGQRAVAELMAASAREAREMPPVSGKVVAQGARAFQRLSTDDSQQARRFSERCHDRAADDGGWDALDFCVAFDEAAYISGMGLARPASDGFFVDRHDRAAHFYVSKASSMDSIDQRLAEIQSTVAAKPSSARTGSAQVIHGISKRGLQIASAAWRAVNPIAADEPPSKPAQDF